MQQTTKDLHKAFDRWFARPIKALKKVPNNDGALVALATACFLYERYADAALGSANQKVSEKRKIKQLEKDFALSPKDAETFWDVVRNGLLHKAMPKQFNYGKKTDWEFSTNYSIPIDISGSTLKVNPWHVVDKVLSLWKQNIKLFDQNKNFPLATIVSEQNLFTTRSP